MRPTKTNLLKKLSRFDADDVAGPFAEKCRRWLGRDENQDGRGTRARAIRRAYYSCLLLDEALRAREHEDSTVRRAARKAVRGLPHQNFPDIRRRLGELHGLKSRLGKRAADRRRQEAARTIEIDDRHELQELRSVASLRSVGRAFDNCVEDEREAREYLRAPGTEMWVLRDRAERRPLCLMEVNLDFREIAECKGPSNATPKLKRSLAFAILDALDVSGNDRKTFVRVGAYSEFRGGQPEGETVETGGRRYRIWILDGDRKIVVAVRKPPSRRWGWSIFFRDGGYIRDHRRNALSTGELLALVVDHPVLATKLHGAAG